MPRPAARAASSAPVPPRQTPTSRIDPGTSRSSPRRLHSSWQRQTSTSVLRGPRRRRSGTRDRIAKGRRSRSETPSRGRRSARLRGGREEARGPSRSRSPRGWARRPKYLSVRHAEPSRGRRVAGARDRRDDRPVKQEREHEQLRPGDHSGQAGHSEVVLERVGALELEVVADVGRRRAGSRARCRARRGRRRSEPSGCTGTPAASAAGTGRCSRTGSGRCSRGRTPGSRRSAARRRGTAS